MKYSTEIPSHVELKNMLKGYQNMPSHASNSNANGWEDVFNSFFTGVDN